MGTQAGRAINDDARAFRQRADRRYDMIMMYTVDSHTKLAATAGLRLDSYLYTVESFEQIRDHLAPGGVFVMNFNLSQESLPWARARLNAMLDKVFGPGSWRKEEAVGGYVHLVKPTSMDQAIRDALVPRDIALATDDWPQFYLRDRMIPGPY
ncbi:MAG: hypothetical protein FJ279_26220, partial [Planctomycetes bacterium]|nr:hypothetical protein [Planctomycetota bacterium]